jgi:hypothetical protein
MHLPITSPEVSTIQAASKPCSASKLLGKGRPCKDWGGELLSAFLTTGLRSVKSVDEGDNAGIPSIASTKAILLLLRLDSQKLLRL